VRLRLESNWRRYEPLKQAGFYPVSEAWKIFEPVGLPGEAKGVDIPEVKAVEAAFTSELALFIKMEIKNQVKDLDERIVKSSNNPRLINSWESFMQSTVYSMKQINNLE